MAKTIAIIPARGGSKRLPDKNIINFNNRPLIYWTIKAAQESKIFDYIFVSTDSPKIRKIAIESGAEVPFLRRKKDADDITPVSIASINSLIKLESYLSEDSQIIIQLMPNCPFRNSEDIIKAYNNFSSSKTKFQVSVFKFGWMNPWWAMEMNDKSFKPKPIFANTLNQRSQDLPDLYCPTGAIWIAESKELKKQKTFYGKNYIIFPMDWENALDIDNIEDLKMAELLIK